jgi:hypothetical protein
MVLSHEEEENHPAQDIASTFFLNALNPTLIFSFALVFTILSKIMDGAPIGFSGTSVFIVGIALGTLGLWYAIGRLIRYLRRKNRDSVVKKTNYVAGVVLLIAGLVVLGLATARLLMK